MGAWTGETERGKLIDDKDIKILSPEKITFRELAEITGGIPYKREDYAKFLAYAGMLFEEITGEEPDSQADYAEPFCFGSIYYPRYGVVISIDDSFSQSGEVAKHKIYRHDAQGKNSVPLIFPVNTSRVVIRTEAMSATYVTHQQQESGLFSWYTLTKDEGFRFGEYQPIDRLPDEETMRAASQLLMRVGC